MRNKPFLKNFSLLIGCAVLILIFAETILRFTPHQFYIHQNCRLPPYYLKIDSISGFDFRKNFPPAKFSFVDGSSTVWTNELGCFDNPYRGEKDYIFLAGDSFTWGGHVPFEKTIGSQLENFIGKRILKCGVVGYGTKAEYLKIKKVTSQVKRSPRLILLAYFEPNDFLNDLVFPEFTVIDGFAWAKRKVDNLEKGELKTCKDFELQEQIKNFYQFGTPVKPAGFTGALQAYLRKHSMLYYLVKNVPAVRYITVKLGLTAISTNTYMSLPPLVRNPGILHRQWEDHLAALKRIRDFSLTHNSRFLVIFIPGMQQVYKFMEPQVKKDSEEIVTMIKQFLVENDIGYLDLAPIFRECAFLTPRQKLDLKNDLYWQRDGHLNINGNTLASLAISRHILAHNLIEISDKQTKLTLIEGELKKFGK